MREGSAQQSGEVRAPGSRRARIALVAGIVVVAGAGVWLSGCRKPSSAPRRPPTQVEQATGAFMDMHDKQYGSPDAKVQVLALLPLTNTCQSIIINYLRSVGEEVPDKVRVRFLDFASAAAQEEFRRLHKDNCATVFINDRCDFTDPTSGASVTFSGPANESYSPEDVRLALQREIARHYGEAAAELPLSGFAARGGAAAPAPRPARPAGK